MPGANLAAARYHLRHWHMMVAPTPSLYCHSSCMKAGPFRATDLAFRPQLVTSQTRVAASFNMALDSMRTMALDCCNEATNDQEIYRGRGKARSNYRHCGAKKRKRFRHREKKRRIP
eukprot:3243311-Amphidinium_carterae.1